MFTHLTLVAIRNLRKNPWFSFMAIAGLALGMAACVTLVNYALNEQSYDAFHSGKDSIYRVESFFAHNGQVTDSWASSSFGYGPAMKKEFPEIKEFVRVNNEDCERIVRYNRAIFREPRVVLADSNFFSFFSYPLTRGDVHTVLREPNSIVISETAAKKYFQGEDPIGKIMTISTQKTKYSCAVTGVFRDFPHKSNLRLDLIISYPYADKWKNSTWYMHQAYTYVKVNSAGAAASVESKFPALAEKYKTEAAFKDHIWGVHLVPLTSIHLNPVKQCELEEKGSRTAINLLFIIAFLILVVSWVNYINLFISKAMQRAGEIGVRKMTGATPVQILWQFIGESLLVNLIALTAFFILMLVITNFASLLSLQDILYDFWWNRFTWEIIIAAFLGGSFITGVIPALVLRRLKLALVLKNRLAFNSGSGNAIRRGLITFQYFSAVVLIISTLTIRKQLLYMQSQDLGISVSQTLVFKAPPKIDSLDDQRMEAFADRLRQMKGVRHVTLSSAIPGKMVGYEMTNRNADDPLKTNKMCEMFRVDYDFLPAYDLRLVKGRNFSKAYPTDREQAVILTETAMSLFGFRNADEAVKGAINLEGHGDKRYPVVGVVKDYHQLSLKEDFRPIVFMVYNPWKWIDDHYITVKADHTGAASLVALVKDSFGDAYPESSFDYFFLDDYYNQQYRQDIRYGQFVMIFSLMALVIVMLGLVSMSGLMLLRRKKEIGIRKVNGAGTFQILQLLNMHFIKLIVAALVMGVPVALLAMHGWLQNFSNRTSVDPAIPLVAGLTILVVTVMTVTVLSYREAVQNPVRALRED